MKVQWALFQRMIITIKFHPEEVTERTSILRFDVDVSFAYKGFADVDEEVAV